MKYYTAIMGVSMTTRTRIPPTRDKENEIVNFGGKWVELEEIILSEVAQTHKDKYDKFSLICST